MQEQYLKAFSEVEQIIALMPEGLQKKIPEKFKNILSTWKNKNYVPYIQEPFEECNIMEETKIILAVIYRDFLCSEKEKKEIKLRDSQKLQEYEKELKEKYNPDDIFKKKNKNIEQNFEKTAISVVKKEKWYKKIFNIIKGVYRKVCVNFKLLMIIFLN